MTSAREIRVIAPGKVNLFLEVQRKRADGFHEIETLMVSVDLCDELTLREAKLNADPVSVDAQWRSGLLASPSVSHANAWTPLPLPEKNLAYKALMLLRARKGVESPIHVRLEKQIPLEAGLGGASADAAAALQGGDAIWGLGLKIDELTRLAADLGSDVPFFLHGGYALCQGRGEVVTPIQDLPPIWVVIVKPPFGLPTPLVYGKCKIPGEPRKMEGLLSALRNRDEFAMASQVVNRLWHPALQIEPRLASLPQVFSEAGLVVHQMSGSGSSYFGVTFDRLKAIRAAAILTSRAIGFTWVGRGGAKSGTKNACNSLPDTLSS